MNTFDDAMRVFGRSSQQGRADASAFVHGCESERLAREDERRRALLADDLVGTIDALLQD